MKFNHEEGQAILETEQDLQDTLKKYDCETEDELDDVLWYTYGVSLINKIPK